MDPIVIIGTGLAGYGTAKEFRKHDTETPLVLVTADDGTSYSKPMLSNAMARGKTADELAQADAEAMAQQLDARILTGRRVESLDTDSRTLALDDGTELAARAIVLAIGADQADPRLDGDAADEAFAVNDLDAYRRLRGALDGARRVVLVGGGLIGCEFANDWVKSGYEVSVIEPLAHPLGRMLPPLAGANLADSLRGAGIELFTGRAATAIDRDGDGLVVRDDAGDAHAADVVVRAIGLRPRLQLARAAGLATERGIAVDRALETSAAGIFALGDCAEVDGVHLPFIMPIQQCARALGPTLAGQRTEVDYPVMPVIAKTPCCPIQLYGPPAAADGEWHEERIEGGTRSLFRDPEGKLRGFALTGAAVQEKGEWAKQVPGWFANREAVTAE